MCDNSLKNKIALYSAVSLSILPIFAPYEFIGPLLVSHIFLISAYFFSIVVTKKVNINYSLMFLFLSHAIFSIIAYSIRIEEAYSERIAISLLYTFFNVILFSQTIKSTNKEKFYNIALKIGSFVSFFLIFQFVLMSININPPQGTIPGLKLNDSQGWLAIDINNIYLRRVHSIFPEPSYFAIYILPLLYIALQRNKKFLAVLFIVSLFLSTSSLGIIGGIFIIIYHFLFKKSLNHKIIIALFSFLTFYLLINVNFSDEGIISYNLTKIFNLFENSQLRLSGYIEYFGFLPDSLKLFGIGYNQLPYYFAEYNLKNYSNAFVLLLINFGILGLISFIVFIMKNLWNSMQEPIFILLFILISSVDAFLYNMYFYYILTFVYLNIQKPIAREEYNAPIK